MTRAPALPARHFVLALAVVAIWGTNFAIMKVALGAMPPLLFATLRFALALLPAAFFIQRPAVPWRLLALYGVLIGVGQFGVLYVAVQRFISPGMASLVVQTQVFFTILLAIAIDGERVRGFQWLGLLLAAGGIAVIALHVDASTTPLGLAMVLFAALAWAGGNLVARHSGRVNMLGYMVWSSLFALPPLLLGSLWLEGWPAMAAALRHADAATWAAVLWQSLGNTLFGYAAWAWLLARHPAATVAPMALLVPVFGMGASALWLAEPLPAWKLAAAALVIAGLALNLLWPKLSEWMAAA